MEQTLSDKLYKASLGLHPFTGRNSTRKEAFLHIAKLNGLYDAELEWKKRIDKKLIFEEHCNNCKYFCGQEDYNGDVVITYCSHSRNKSQNEGNTRIECCPLEEIK